MKDLKVTPSYGGKKHLLCVLKKVVLFFIGKEEPVHDIWARKYRKYFVL